MFERFTDEARAVVVEAQAEARELRHGYIGCEHLLLGLLRVPDTAASDALRAFDVTLEGTRARVHEIVSSGDSEPQGQMPFTPRAKKVLELSLREALSMATNAVGPEHLLLGLLREDESIAARILHEQGVSPEQVRQAVTEGRRPEAETAQRRLALSEAGLGIRVGLAPEVRRLLMRAGARALDDGRTEIETADLRAALGEAPQAGK